METKKISVKKNKKVIPTGTKKIVQSNSIAAQKDKKIKDLTKALSKLRSEMKILFEFGKTVTKQKELLNKVLRFHKADKKELEKAVTDRTKQFEQKNTELKL